MAARKTAGIEIVAFTERSERARLRADITNANGLGPCDCRRRKLGGQGSDGTCGCCRLDELAA